MPELQKRAVAGSFIFRFPNCDETQRPQVALFKRSGDVRTYPHKYAPVSGSVEPTDESPLATAWRELQEETSLTSSSLRLYRQGKPYTFGDESVGREWTINPFAFVLRPDGEGEAGIRLDWEHESYAWFDPGAVSEDESFGGVPRLLESLRRVWFNIDLGDGAGETLRLGLLELQKDHDSGARQLASKAQAIFADVLLQLENERAPRDTWWCNARFAGWHLWKNGRESMGASVLSVVLSSLAIAEERLPSEISRPVAESIAASIRASCQQREQQMGGKIRDAFSTYLDENFGSRAEPIKIVTLSSSSTITSCLAQVLKEGKHPLHIRVLESRPLFEGVKTAQALANTTTMATNSKVTIFTDASAAIASKDADIVLLGADLISRTGDISNKSGSLPTVLAARHVSPRVRVVSLAELEKVLPFEPPSHDEENDAGEVRRHWKSSSPCSSSPEEQSNDPIDAKKGRGPSLNVRNVYFEWVSANLVDAYVTEDGVKTAEDIAAYAEQQRLRADRFFEGL